MHFSPLCLLLQWFMLCLTDHLVPIPQSAFFLGCVLGSLLSGVLNYFLGRRLTLHLTVALVALFGVLSAMSVVFTMYVIMRLLTGIFVQVSITVSHTWILELTGPDHRGSLPVYTTLFAIAGTAWLPVLFAIMLDWRWLEGFVSLLALGPLLYLW